MIQTPEAVESPYAANYRGETEAFSWERHARSITTSLLMLGGGTRGNPAREPVKAAVLRAIQRDARLIDLQVELEGMPMTAAIARALRRVAPYPMLQLPISSDDADSFVRAWAFEAACDVEGETALRARSRDEARATEPVSAFVVSMLLDLTGMELGPDDLQYVKRATAVAVSTSANYDELIEALWARAEPAVDEFVMRLRYLSRPSAVASMFGALRLDNTAGIALNA